MTANERATLTTVKKLLQTVLTANTVADLEAAWSVIEQAEELVSDLLARPLRPSRKNPPDEPSRATPTD